MMDYLLRLLSIRTTGAGRITEVGVELHGLNPAYVALALAGLVGLAVWLYRRQGDVSPVRRYIMAALRGLFLLLVLGLLLRPVLSVTFEHIVRRTILLVVDSSSSMSQIHDQRSDENDLKRVALARDLLDPAVGLKQALPQAASGLSQASRLQVVQAALKNKRMDLLSRLGKDYDLAAFTFDKSISEIPAAGFKASIDQQTRSASLAELPRLDLGWVDGLQAPGAMTAIGDSLREVISRKRGQGLAGIVLITDGASNSGYQPVDAAKLAGQDRVPLYVWGVGITSPRDIIVAKNLFVPEVAFVKDDVPVTVRVRSMGMAGQSAKLQVKMGDELAEKEVLFNADGEQVVTLNLTPKTAGDFVIDAAIPAREDEVVKDNNSASQRIRVIDRKIKVLLVDHSPRWEFKYLQAILMRDRRVELKCMLLEGDASITRGSDTPYLAELPRQKEELFKYDCIVLGDVDAKAFSPSQLEMLGEFVSKFGGAMVMLAGKRHNPVAYRRTVLEKMLPVELESADSAPSAANRPIRPELTAAGKSSLMLRLSERDQESIMRWNQLPPFYWVAKIARAKPAAEVLLVDPDPSKASRWGKMPIIALQQYGMGQVLFVGTDNLWRWRRNAGDRYHAMLWGQIVQRMAMPHLLGASKRTQLSTDQKEYTAGSKATLYARLYSESFEPMVDPIVRGMLTPATDQLPPREVQLRAIPGQPGMYRGETIPAAPGLYRFAVDHDKATVLELTVTEPRQELAETAMNQALLEQMASASSGRFFREETLYQLPEAIKEKAQPQRTTVERELWSSPIYFLVMLGLVTAEWIMRKVAQLK